MSTESQGLTGSAWEISLPYYHDDLVLSGETDHSEASRTFLVPGGQGGYPILQLLISQFLGYPYMVQVAGIPTMRRWLPETTKLLMDSDEDGFLFAHKYKLRPLSGDGTPDYSMPDAPTKEQLTSGSQQSQMYRAWENLLLTIEFKSELFDVVDIDTIDEKYHNSTYFPSTGGIQAVYAPEMFRFVTIEEDDKVDMGVADRAAWVYFPKGPPKAYDNVQTAASAKLTQLLQDALNAALGNTSSISGQSIPVGDKLGIPYPAGEVTVTWWNVAADAFSSQIARALMGKTNLFQFLDYYPGQLVFIGFKRRKRRNILGTIVCNIEFKFLLRPHGANYFITSNGAWALICSASNPAVHPIRYADYGYLFLPYANTDLYADIDP